MTMTTCFWWRHEAGFINLSAVNYVKLTKHREQLAAFFYGVSGEQIGPGIFGDEVAALLEWLITQTISLPHAPKTSINCHAIALTGDRLWMEEST